MSFAVSKWVGKRYCGETYRTSGDAQKHTTILGSYRERVKFRFETVWIVREPDDGITTVTTPDGRRLIGYNDLYMGPYSGDTVDFCQALIARQIEAGGPGPWPEG
jgi:homospermidine synthase